jgi:alpha-L-fucosidase 2
MKNFFIPAALFFLLCAACTNDKQQPLRLWYKQPAAKWLDASPMGNGRLGAMVYGGTDTDRIALTESSLWSGQFDANQDKPFGAERLRELRQLFFEGKLQQGNEIAAQWLKGNYNSFGTHLPMGDLKIVHHRAAPHTAAEYHRELDLRHAVKRAAYKIDDVEYSSEYFVSNPADVVVVRIAASKPRMLNFDVSMDLLRQAEISFNEILTFTGKVSFYKHGPGGVEFAGGIGVKTQDGETKFAHGALHITNATSAVIAIDIRTNYKAAEGWQNKCHDGIMANLAVPYDTLKNEHIRDYASIFNRVELKLGNINNDELPTDERLEYVRNGRADAGFDALFFQYGRYLLIASSRENSPLPAALQGIWNDNLACHMGWTNDYHLDINTQQNYWLANAGNLAQCHTPLFSYIKDLAQHGAATARRVYGCGGWCAHTVANIWGYSAPSQAINWGLFPLAGSWIASHLWTQYKYTQDTDFLTNVAYPLLKSNARFILDFLVEDPKSGYLMTGPCISPENSFRWHGAELCASMMPYGDRALAFEILTAASGAADILGIDNEFADSVRTALSKIPPYKINRYGALQEWYEDYEEAHPEHRHTMHLTGLYPLGQISPSSSPDLAQAAKTTIERRIAAKGWEDTEWSRANFMCYYARLRDAAKAYNNLQELYKTFARSNLFCVAPAGVAGADADIFEFDANEAAPAAIAEMLVQSVNGCIELLPALPQQWNSGYVRGLCVEGGAEVDIQWKHGKVQHAMLRAKSSNTFNIKLPHSHEIIAAALKKGDTFVIK